MMNDRMVGYEGNHGQFFIFSHKRLCCAKKILLQILLYQHNLKFLTKTEHSTYKIYMSGNIKFRIGLSTLKPRNYKQNLLLTYLSDEYFL
jgi:hypothetical protein